MNRLKLLNLLCFLFLLLIFVVFQYFVDFDVLNNRSKPWHLDKGDSLSQTYLNKYKITNQLSLQQDLVDDISYPLVLILVDAWGVSYKEYQMEKEFDFFDKKNKREVLHKRLTEFTRYAELSEYKLESMRGLYLFGGDSLEYERSSYIKDLGYETHLFCQKCGDDVMLNFVDSVLNSQDIPDVIALTTQSSRGGDKDSLHNSLKQIADLAYKHSDITFVVQGTHRPILCPAKIREQYYQHWVPVVMVNLK